MNTATQDTPNLFKKSDWMLRLWAKASAEVPNLEAYIPSLPPARSNLSRNVKICALLLGFATLTYWAYDTIYRRPLFLQEGHNWVTNLKGNWYLGIPTTACGLFAWADWRHHQGKEKQTISTLNGSLNLMFSCYATHTELPIVKENLRKAFHNLYPGHSLPSSLT